jgi:hypothetical protein
MVVEAAHTSDATLDPAMDGLLGSPVRKILFDHALIEIGQHAAMLCDPA